MSAWTSPSRYTDVPGLWTREWWPISFTLYVDDLGVTYIRKEHANYLMAILKEQYTISHNWSGCICLSMNIYWDYTNNKAHLFILS